jgi:hypothetical protein
MDAACAISIQARLAEGGRGLRSPGDTLLDLRTSVRKGEKMTAKTLTSIVVLSLVIALQMPLGLAAAGPGEENKELRVTKDCSPVTLAPGELPYCTVTASNFRPLIGAKIRYFGPGFFTADHLFLDSWVVIESEEGNGTAFGHCLVRAVPSTLGACQFTGGSGTLRGFKADVTVTTDDGLTWHWNGAMSN